MKVYDSPKGSMRWRERPDGTHEVEVNNKWAKEFNSHEEVLKWLEKNNAKFAGWEPEE